MWDIKESKMYFYDVSPLQGSKLFFETMLPMYRTYGAPVLGFFGFGYRCVAPTVLHHIDY